MPIVSYVKALCKYSDMNFGKIHVVLASLPLYPSGILREALFIFDASYFSLEICLLDLSQAFVLTLSASMLK